MAAESTDPGSVVPVENNVEYWAKRWEDNKIGWHMPDVNPDLIRFTSYLTSGHAESQILCNAKSSAGRDKKIFVPLCGKSKDIAYLLSLGFQVFGVEVARKAIEELNDEDGLGLKFNQQDSMYHTCDNKLQIYLGDFYECPIERWGPFDCVWDRGAFIAVDYPDRPKYIEVMKRSLRDQNEQFVSFWYLLATVQYDKTISPGPPRSVDSKDMNDMFGDWTEYQLLDNYLEPEKPTRPYQVNCLVHFLTPKDV